MRLALRLLPLLAVLAASLVLAPPAAAVATVTASPSANLVELQTITVSGTVDPEEQLYVCQGALPFGSGGTFCGNVLLSRVPVSPTGEFSTSYTVRRFMYMNALGRLVDCADPFENCVIFAHAFHPTGEILSTPISFAPPPPPPSTLGSITVDPDEDLQSQDVVTVSGSGFRPDATVEVFQCTPAPENPTDCNLDIFTLATADASGSFQAQHTVGAVISTQGGVLTGCRSAPGACVMAAAEAQDLPGTIVDAPLSFAATADTSLAVTPNTDLVDGQSVTVAGSGFTPGAQVAWCQAVPSPSPDPSDCGSSIGLMIADAQGAFLASVGVQRFMFFLGGPVDCTSSPDACVIAAAEVNDIAATVTYAPLRFIPAVVPGVGRVVEGDTGTADVVVPVNLSGPASEPVTVDWATIHHPGAPASQAEPPADYTTANGTVTFAPGQTAQSVTVSVNGDTDVERQEYFAVSFSNPTNALMGGFLGLGFGVIRNDDVLPSVIAGAASSIESDAGTHDLLIPVTLTKPSAQPVSVDWASLHVPGAGGFQAEPPGDYTAVGGTVTFAPGETTQFVSVPIHGDTDVEADEYFAVVFRNATNAAVLGFQGLGFGIILDDD